MANVRVYIDQNDNAQWDSEPYFITGTDGSFKFADLADGDYVIRVDIEDEESPVYGWVFTGSPLFRVGKTWGASPPNPPAFCALGPDGMPAK